MAIPSRRLSVCHRLTARGDRRWYTPSRSRGHRGARGWVSEERAWRDRTTTGIVLLNEGGQVLMQLRDDSPTIADPGCWVIPGGETAVDEDPAAGARREFLEETGYTIEPSDLHF